jgi:hypothetical protein
VPCLQRRWSCETPVYDVHRIIVTCLSKTQHDGSSVV